jgi:hypothetical protein
MDINQDKYTFTVSDKLKEELNFKRNSQVCEANNNNNFSIYNKNMFLLDHGSNIILVREEESFSTLKTRLIVKKIDWG